MGEEKWSAKTDATTWAATDTLLFLDQSETDERIKLKEISISNIFAGNASGNLTIKNPAHGSNVIISAENAGGTTKTLMTADPDKQTCDFLGITLQTKTQSSDTDALDVAGIGVVVVNTSAGNVTIGGLANGVYGQPVLIIKSSSANSMIIENNEATGTQKIITNTGADLTFGNYGAVLLVYLGTFWFECGGP